MGRRPDPPYDGPMSRQRAHRSRRLAALLSGCLALAACGGPAGTGATMAPVATVAAPASSATVPSAAAPTSTPTPPEPSMAAGDPVLLAVGDIGRCDSTDDDAVGALIATLPGAVATLGDTAYDSGTPDELRNCFGAAWAGVTDRIRYAITGNHDDLTDAGAPLRDYLGRAASRDGRTYFSDELGSWHVVVLDADCHVVAGGCGPDSPQLRWLRDDLAASHAACTLALWHQPRFSSGDHGNDGSSAPFWDALYAGGADIVLNGHDHDYERFDAQDPSAAPDPARGITEFVVGTGGGGPRAFGDIRANSVVRATGVFGVLELTLGDGGWTFRFVATAPGFADEGTGACH